MFIYFFVIDNFFCFKSKTFLGPSFTDSISVIRLQIPDSVFLCCRGKMMPFSYLNNISIDLNEESPLPLSKGT